MNKTQLLQEIFEQFSGSLPEKIDALPRSGSYREYYRLRNDHLSAIGVYNADKKENEAFLGFTKHFLSKQLPVPAVYRENLDSNIYLLEDLGDMTLFSYLNEIREDGEFPHEAVLMYKRIIEELPRFQIYGHQGMDYSIGYPRASFDKQSMMWDLNYFKYYFLKLAKVAFDEQELENDFQDFADWLLEEDHEYFLYRDFQSSNVMIVDDPSGKPAGKPYFIDYQGGRKGALQYDLASLLFDAKANIPPDIKHMLLEYYIDQVSAQKNINEDKFRKYYYGFAYIRLMQAMGAFGFRGFYEKKPSFLKSIPFALKNLDYLLENHPLPAEFSHMFMVLSSLHEAPEMKQFINSREYRGRLMVEINSFSYRRGIPIDASEHGGGFVFDCRAIHNPGRYDEYKEKNGKDPEVIDFLHNLSQADQFVGEAFTIINRSIDTYLEREYTNLMISFGCTGGQHRSVYCSELLKKMLDKKYGIRIDISLHHREEELKKLGL